MYKRQVFEGDHLVGYAEVSSPDRADAAVHPDHRGRGIGTGLARWTQDTARAKGSTVIGMPVPQGSPGDALLERLGYHVRWTSWVLGLPEGTGALGLYEKVGMTVTSTWLNRALAL